MRVALISDVHGNIYALDAVLERLDAEGYDLLVCLGDTVGYSAHPGICLDKVRERADIFVAGNHERELYKPQMEIVRAARYTLDWTVDQLSSEQLDFIFALPNIVVHPAGFIAVHGCYLNDDHYYGYITSTMLSYNLDAIAARRDTWPALGLCGHTHVPMFGWLRDGTSTEERPLPMEEPIRWPPKSDAVLFNPGSVGQPRDGDPRASCAILELEERCARILRVEYDIDSAMRDVLAAGLPARNAERLLEGR